MRFRLAALLLVTSLACAHAPPQAAHAPPRPATWIAPLDRAHPLVGKAWDVRGARFVDDAQIVAATRASAFVLLGEKHDNADHHALQAWIVASLVASGRAPAVAMEQIETTSQAMVDEARKSAPRDAQAIARAVDWDKSGWPTFAMYAPILDVALANGLPLVGANLPHATARALAREGASALGDADRARLGLDAPLAPPLDAALRRELAASHCGMEMPAKLLDGMVLAERARDATMAERMVAADGPGGVVLVAGTGHTRIDRGVPLVLARLAPARARVSVAFVEVDAETDPARYGAAWGEGAPPFDYVMFTPRANDEDPCARFRR